MSGPKAPFLRFLESYEVDHVTGCWNWINFVGPYGAIKVFGKTKEAHRFSYELYKGPIPDALEVMHSCDNKRCVNPDHLSVGPHAKNMAEAKDRGLMRKGKPNPRRGAKSSQSIQVLVNGRGYGSLKEAERYLGLGCGTIRFWLKTAPHKARIISLENYQTLKRRDK